MTFNRNELSWRSAQMMWISWSLATLKVIYCYSSHFFSKINLSILSGTFLSFGEIELCQITSYFKLNALSSFCL